MVFGFFTNLFSTAESNEGVLYKQDEKIGAVELEFKENKLILGDNEIKIEDIASINNKQKKVIIKTKEIKYVYETEKAEEIVKLLHPVIKPHKILFENCNVQYHVFSKETNMFEAVELENLEVKICEDYHHFYLTLEAEPKILHYQEILSSTQYYMDKNNKTFVWSAFKENKFYTFSLKFKENLDFLQFLTIYVECTYKSVNKDGEDSKYYEKMFMVEDKKEDSDDSTEDEKDWNKYNK